MSEEIPELEWHETVHCYGDGSGRYNATLRFHNGYSEYGTDLAAAQDALAFYFKMADVTKGLHDGDA